MQSTPSKELQRSILLVALFCTAFSSLVYELVWCRELSYVFGSTALAASSVLAVLMGGLALGSLYAGKILESRTHRFRFFAQLQFVIGITCILTLFAIKGVSGLQTYLFAFVSEQATFGIKVILFLLTCSVLIAPTFLIGVAFPCIVQLFHTSNDLVGQSVSRCYWIDTLGASLGMLLAAFFLAPRIGFFRTSLVASTLNIFAGILVFLFFRKADIDFKKLPVESVIPGQEPTKKFDIIIISFLFFLSGFSALILEITWIRHWGLIYGNGLHAFAIVVVTFLLGLSLGSLLYDKFLKKIRNQVLLFSVIELCIGATAVIITALFPHMERAFLEIYYGVDNFYVFFIIMSLLCFVLLLIPTMLMGMTLPTLCAISVSDRHVAVDLGKLYAVNSFGALAGSFCTGFIIIPALGIYRSSFAAGIIYTFIAFAFLYCFSKSRFALRKASAYLIGILILTAVVFAGLHKPNHLYNGVFYSGPPTGELGYENYFKIQKVAFNLLRFFKEGVYGQVAAYGQGDNIFLSNDGRIDSSTTSDTRSHFTMLGIIPMLVHEKPANVLNIGLGAGWTVLAVATYPLSESIDSVEINPLIVEACKNVFYPYNDDILNNPKVHTIINDGRNYVSYTKKKYDVIISEPPEFWFSGVSALFTREFYSCVADILNEDGLMCQWFPDVTEKDYKIAVKTIKDIFAYAYEFDMSKVRGIEDEFYKTFLVIGSQKPIDINKRLQQCAAQFQDKSNEYSSHFLSFIRLTQKSYNRDNEALDAHIADVNEVNTDDLPILEFHALKTRFWKFRNE